MANLITGLFETEVAAEEAVAHLKNIGYTQNEISVIMKDHKAAQAFAVDTGAHTMEGIGTGAAIGGTIGAVLAGLLAVGSIAIPGVGLLAAGPLAAMLAGAGAGGLAGSILGWLVSAGIPEDVAPYYERGLQAGGIVVAVATHAGDESRVQDVLNGRASAYGGANIPSYIAPHYASRFHDLTPPPTSYDQVTAMGYQTAQQTNQEAARTLNATGAEMRSADRTTAEHEREARRDQTQSGLVGGVVNAVENEADRVGTALENQTDKVSTGVQNTVDRVKTP